MVFSVIFGVVWVSSALLFPEGLRSSVIIDFISVAARRQVLLQPATAKGDDRSLNRPARHAFIKKEEIKSDSWSKADNIRSVTLGGRRMVGKELVDSQMY